MIFSTIKNIVLQESTIIQLVHLIVDFALGLFIANQIIKKIKKNLFHKIQDTWITTILKPCMTYCVFVGLFIISHITCSSLLQDTAVLDAGFKYSLLIFCFILVLKFTKSKLIATCSTILLIFPYLLYKLGDLNNLVKDIDRFSIKIGAINITPFSLIKGIILLVILITIASIIINWINHRIKNNQRLRPNTKALLTKSIELGIYFLTIVITLNFLGVKLTALAVFGGAFGVGIGFGLQKITSNFISGIILLLEKSIESGDLIELEDVYGVIKNINSRYTLIETFDGKEIMVPNEDFMTNRVTNWTFSNTKGRVEILIGVSYDSNVKKAKELILEAANEHPSSLKDPKPSCFLKEFGDSSINFILYFFISDITKGRLGPSSEIMESIWEKFKENEIELPFPQMDVHVKKD